MPTGHLSLNAPVSGGRFHRALPPHLRLLCVGPEEPSWAIVALRLESLGCDDAEFQWHVTSADAIATLRKQSFDVIVIHDPPVASQTDSTAVRLVEAIRAGGTRDPVAVILTQPDDDILMRLDQFECEVLVSPHGWQSQALGATIRQAVSRGDICRDVSALENAAQRGRIRERDEAEVQLQQLQALVSGRANREADGSAETPVAPVPRPTQVPAQVDAYYGELLRTYVMMGSGTLESELQKLAEILSLSGTAPHETLALHLRQLESLISGLGKRSSRHIMSRADLLALELMIRLAECYRQKSRFRGLGDNGVDLLHAQTLLGESVSS